MFAAEDIPEQLGSAQRAVMWLACDASKINPEAELRTTFGRDAVSKGKGTY